MMLKNLSKGHFGIDSKLIKIIYLIPNEGKNNIKNTLCWITKLGISSLGEITLNMLFSPALPE